MLSPEGRSHIPIPHLMRVLNVSDILPSEFTVSFIGNPGYITRTKAIEYFYKQYHNNFFLLQDEKIGQKYQKNQKLIFHLVVLQMAVFGHMKCYNKDLFQL